MNDATGSMRRRRRAAGVAALEKSVARIVGPAGTSSATLERIAHARDLWPRDLLRVRVGEIPALPAVIAWPETVQHVSRLVKLAAKEGIPVVPFGGGAGVCGGAKPGAGALVIDLKRMKTIREVDRTALHATVESGINGEWLERGLRAQGFTLGHFPSSIYCSTLGGFIAARSAGQLSTKYGKIEDMISGLEVVLPDGAIANIPGWEPALGPSIEQIITGSEGTLGIVTAAGLRIHPAPAEQVLMGVEFRGIDPGLTAIRKMLQSGLRPAVVRLYDEFDTILSMGGEESEGFAALLSPKHAASSILSLFPSIGAAALSTALIQPRALNALANLLGEQCLLILGFEGPLRTTRAEAEEGRAICLAEGGHDLGEAPADRWLRHRYSVGYKQSKVFQAGAFNDTAEVAGTWDSINDLYRNVKKAIGRRAFVMAHFSHAYPEGCSIYFTFIARARNVENAERLYDEIWADLLAATLESGGTISHHHGVGISKARFLADELGPGGMGFLKTIKVALDPKHTLNPGTLGL